jgi:protein-tyrosine kinase
VDRSAKFRLTPYPVDRAPGREVSNADQSAPLPPFQPWVSYAQTQLQPWVSYTQTRQFTPEPRRLASNLVIGADAPRGAYTAYNFLRSQIIKRLQENGWNAVAITSPSGGSGSTLTALNLGISIARSYSYTVLLVELDLVNPSLHRMLGFTQRQGMVDHLLEDVPVADILINPGIDRLVLIPAGSPVINSAELLSSLKMGRLVEQLKHRYQDRIVLFDLPPVLAHDDAMAFAQYVDCALLVVEEGETRVDEIRRAVDYLSPTNILGVVLNRSIHAGRTIRR